MMYCCDKAGYVGRYLRNFVMYKLRIGCLSKRQAVSISSSSFVNETHAPEN